jgi:hypothetical protein
MKKLTLILTIALFWAVQPVWACDVCAGGAGAGFTGLLPGMPQNFIGLRSGYQSFQHPQTALNFNGTSRVKQDLFVRNEVVLRYFLKPKWQLLAQIPHQIHTRYETEQTTEIQGIGDFQIGLLYKVLERENTDFKHSLFAGFTMGLPTGTYQKRDANLVLMPERFQIGAGAFSGQLRALYFLRKNNFGWMADYSYRHFGTNEIEFQMGGQQVAVGQFFYTHKKTAYTLVPALGVQWEAFQEDRRFGNIKPETGGQTLLAQMSVDVYLNKWLFQASAQYRLWNNLPEAMPIAGTRLGVMVARVF